MKNTIPLYRTVLTQAWKVTRERKALWFWGLFAALLGNAGEYQFLSAASNSVGTRVTPSFLLNSPAPSLSLFHGLWSVMASNPLSVLILIILSIVGAALVAFFVWLATVSVIGLIRGASEKETKSRGFLNDLDANISETRPVFASVLITYIFGRILLWLIMGLIALFATLVLIDFYIGLPLFIAAFLVLLPALFLVSFAVRFAVMFIVLKKKGILESLELGFALVRQHWIVSVELAFILLCVNALAAFFLLAFIYIIVLPFIITATIFWQAGLALWATALSLLAILGFLFAVFVFGSILTVFQWATWTTLFVRLQQKNRILPKVIRLLNNFIPDRPLRVFGRT